MVAANECLKIIDAAAKGELSDDEIGELVKELDRIRKTHAVADNLTSLEEALFDKAGQIIQDVELAAKIAKRERYRNIVVRAHLLDMATRAHDELGDAALAIEAAAVGVNSKLLGGRLSADARGHALMREYFGALVADMREQGVLGAYVRGDHSLDVARELWDISSVNPTGRATSNAEAKKIAAAIHKVRTAAVKRENRAGAYIRMLDSYITRQSHDRLRMEAAGRDAWATEVRGRLDWDRMEIVPEDRENFLTSAYEALISGVRKTDAIGADENDLLVGFKGPGNLAKRDSAHRVLHFKSADDWFAYNERFGQRSLNEAINADLHRAATNTALMETFGPNFRAMIDTVKAELKKRYRSDTAQIRSLDSKTTDWFLAELDGTVNIPHRPTLAGIGRMTRNMLTMAKLGMSVISAITDIAFTAGERRHQGRSLMDAWGDALVAPIQGMTASGEKRAIADRLGVGLDGLLGASAARFAAQDDVPGKMSKLMSRYFKLTGLTGWTDGTKRAAGLMTSYDLAQHAKRSFDELPPQVRRNLAQYGMDADKWEIARNLVHEASDGRRYMIPDEIDNLDLPQLKGHKGERLKDEVRDIVGTYISDRVEFASPTPGARERAYMRMGIQPGTAPGELLRSIMHLKSFAVTVVSRPISRDLYSGGAKSLGDAVLRGEGDVVGLANMIAGSTVLGYVALQMKEIAKGRNPREASPELFIASMMQGGALGIYGDFLLGETNRYGQSLPETLAGPTIGAISDLKKILDKARAGDDAWASSIRFAQNNLIPGSNLFYTKAAMDYLVFFQLQEMANPGYLRRMERRMLRENGNTYMIPPTTAIPPGGGTRLGEGVR